VFLLHCDAAQGQSTRECPTVESFMEPIVVASVVQLRWAIDAASGHLERA